jgi:hypothetical protein
MKKENLFHHPGKGLRKIHSCIYASEKMQEEAILDLDDVATTTMK